MLNWIFDLNHIKMILISLLLVTAFFVVVARSAIHSILWLILLFVISALTFIGVFNLYFIGVLFIVVYVGAVTVLFLFIIIMIPLREVSLHSSRNLLLSFSGFVFCVLLFSVSYYGWDFDFVNQEIISSYDFVTRVRELFDSDLHIVSYVLYYRYSFALVIAALLLFIALVVAILLCKI